MRNRVRLAHLYGRWQVRIAHMVERGIAPENILGVTFTNKAAREMKQRVTKLLPSRFRKSRDGTKPAGPTVSTFHSLCARILREHIEMLGYKRNFVIYDESEQLGAIRKILSHLSAKGEKTDPKAILSLLSRFKNGTKSRRTSGSPPVMRNLTMPRPTAIAMTRSRSS